MFRRLATSLLLTAFVMSCGGHWYALQGVAWVKMVAEFSENVPVAEAVQMAVSGEYPCQMCKAISEKKHEEKQQQAKLPDFKKDFLTSSASFQIYRLSATWVYPPAVEFPLMISAVPPTPPPKTA